MEKLFQPSLNKISKNRLDGTYIGVLNHPCHKALLEEMWAKYARFADSGFPSKIALSFHERFWEMYLGYTLIVSEKELEATKGVGPDLRVIGHPQALWIEATAASDGTGADAVPKEVSGELPSVWVKKIILRFRTAIEAKLEKYNTYLGAGILKSSDPFVIGISKGGMSFNARDKWPPLIIQAVFPVGDANGKTNNDTTEKTPDHMYRDEIFKLSGGSVRTDVFQDPRYAGISAILYCVPNVLFAPPEQCFRGLDFTLVHNPLAKNPVFHKSLPSGREFWFSGRLLKEHAQSSLRKFESPDLMEAARQGQTEIILKMIEAETDPNKSDEDGFTALIWAASRGQTETVQKLIDEGADPNKANNHGETALAWAALGSHTETVQKLIDGGADPNKANNHGETALMASVHCAQTETIQTLIDKGTDLNKSDEDDFTALIWAAFCGQTETVQRLINGGADSDKANNHGETALILAALHGHAETVQGLIDRGADLDKTNKDGSTALILAALYGHTETVQKLIDEGTDPNKAKKDGSTALILAASRGHTEIVQRLIDGGADPNKANNYGETALMVSAYYAKTETIQTLIDKGTDLNKSDEDGFTALIWAAFCGHTEIVQRLIDGGADPNKANNHGETALILAESRGHKKIAQTLIQAGCT